MKFIGRFLGHWYVTIVFALVIASQVFTTYLIIDQRREENWIECVHGNSRRGAIQDAFNLYTRALIAASENQPRTPIEDEQRQRSIERFEMLVAESLDILDPIECGPRP